MRRETAEKSEEFKAIQEQRIRQEVDEAQQLFRSITKPKAEGGFGFHSMKHFAECLFGNGTDAQMKANITRWCNNHGSDFASNIFEHSTPAFTDFLSNSTFSEKLRKEGEAIQKLLSRPSKMSMRDLLASFSMQDLSQDLMTVAPTLWGVLTSVSSQRKSRREKELVCFLLQFIAQTDHFSGFYSNLCYAQLGPLTEGQ